jgi:hypothetical protein
LIVVTFRREQAIERMPELGLQVGDAEKDMDDGMVKVK